MTIDPNDPKLTAYVLGELNEQDHAEVEAAISQSAELRRVVKEIRGTTDLLAKELVGESPLSLSPDQRTAIETEAAKPRVRSRLSRVRQARWFAPLGAGASIAAVLAIAFSLGQVRYGDFGRAARQRLALAHIKGIGTSSRVYDAGSNEGWMIPPFPEKTVDAVSRSTRKARSTARRMAPKTKKRTATPSRDATAVTLGWGTFDHPSQSINYGYQVPFEQPIPDPPDGLVGAYESADASAWTPEGPPSNFPAEKYYYFGNDGELSEPLELYWDLVKNGEVSVDRFICPSSGDVEGDEEGTYAFAEDEAAGENFSEEKIMSADEPQRVLAGMAPKKLANWLQQKPPDVSASTIKAPSRPATSNAKIIKTGSMTLEVDDYTQAVERMRAIAKKHGATVADASTSEQTGGALSGRLVIRVSPERFDPLFKALKSVGRIEAENVNAADVTANYVDLESRISSLKITQARLAELVTNKSFIDKMSALLEVEREMTRIRTQLEQLMGQLRVMADRVALSTITALLHEPPRIVPSAALSVEVPVLDDAATALGATLNQLGGRLISGKTSKRNGGTLKGDYQLQINLAKFAELLVAVESLGRVEQRRISDRQFGSATAPWAQTVQCNLSLVLFERSRQLPLGSIQIEVDDLKQSLAELDIALTQHDGSVVSNQTSRRPDGSGTAELKLRVSAGRFADVVESITKLGRVTGRAVSGEAGRIVGGLARVPSEISLTLAERVREVPSGQITLEVEAFETAREQLSRLVADKGVQVLASSSSQRTDGSWAGYFQLGIKAEEMDAVLTSLVSLGRVASRQITGLGLGDLSRIDPSAMGIIRLTLGEKAAINPGPERTGDSLRSRLRDGLAGLYSSLGFIAYGLIVMAPWLILVVSVAWLVMRVRRRRAAQSSTP